MRLIIGLILSLSFYGVALADMVTVTPHTANLWSSPAVGGSYSKLQVPRYYPLEVVGESGSFLRVSDCWGRNGWIANSEVEKTKGVVVKSAIANVRQGPGMENDIIFKAKQGVSFKVLNKQNNWLEVEHESGKTGWIYKTLLWGL